MLDHQLQDQSAIRTDLGAIFISLELSRSTWLITSLSPGAGEKLSRHSISAGDVGGLLCATDATGASAPIADPSSRSEGNFSSYYWFCAPPQWALGRGKKVLHSTES
jgi:hypothetical protein